MLSDRLLFAGLPAIATVALHGLLVLMLLFRWNGPAQVIAAAPTVQPIQASLVQAETLKPKPKPKPKLKPNPKPETMPKAEAEPVSPPEPPSVSEAKPEPAPAEETSPSPVPTLDAEQLAMLTREELKTLTDTEVGVAGAEAPSLRDMVAATIRAAVINRWTRPPSARNGMVSVLSIQLVPTGEVVGVSVLQSSGNSAFDRSAMNAVERAGRFPEVAKLEDRIFEANFRRFQLIFKP
ncbi:MAG: energy transducer TonB, partial [Halieaceae bacterium]